MSQLKDLDLKREGDTKIQYLQTKTFLNYQEFLDEPIKEHTKLFAQGIINL